MIKRHVLNSKRSKDLNRLFRNKCIWEFPGGPVVRALPRQGVQSSVPGRVTGMVKKKKKPKNTKMKNAYEWAMSAQHH